ncbi:MAG TPA: FtsQ-type POTRA domain-containing protein [Acidimicrobiales bacterium]|nr:FtsQ-type POTRA domain-containing protein [Acidimicrobiales bacterium]
MTQTRQRGRRGGPPTLYDQAGEPPPARPPVASPRRARRWRGHLRAVPGPELFDQERDKETGAPEQPAPAPRAAPPALPIDPRIRRRRIEVRRDEGRRRRRIVVSCVVAAAAVAGAAGATRSPLLDVDRVVLRGAEHTRHDAVVELGHLASSPPMLDVDTATLARRVEALPWVLDARARRQWPSTIRVDVVERRPAAVLPAGEGTWALADGTGRVLAVGPEKPPGLPVLGAVPAPGRPGTTVGGETRPSLAVAAALPDDLRSRIADVAAVPGGEVELQLVPPGGVVRLGPPVDLDEKFRVLATVLARAELAGVAVIDVRVPRAPALTRR